jgi:hypothetical protein
MAGNIIPESWATSIGIRSIIDIYASGGLSRDAYVEKNRELDGMTETLRARAKELSQSLPLCASRVP